MKKIAKLSIIMLLMMFVLTVNVYAKLNCNINMQSKQEQEITINVNLSNIESERGIIAIEAILEYDKDCLTLSKMEGQNSWHTPIEGLSYNASNGKLVIDKEGLAKNDETILKITFKANKTSKKSTTVSLKNIVVADGTAPAKIANVSKNITIKDEEEKTDTKPTTGGEQKPTPSEEQKPDKEPTPSKNQNTSNTNNTKTTVSEKPTTNEEQKSDTVQMSDEEQETNNNTDTIIDEEQETNITSNEGENTDTNQTVEDIYNKDSFTAERKRNLIISLSALLVISIIVGVIIYKKRRMR